MQRGEALEHLRDEFDVLVIGGGATGLGTALDSATRGYRTALVTRDDFSQATSSRSTKLIHGGVRYLEQGDIKLVREALQERGILMRNAPNVVHPLRFLIPAYGWREIVYYSVGLKLYDLLAGRLNVDSSRPVSRRRAVALARTVNSRGLKGGVVYSDGQFNDSRLALALAKTAAQRGAVLVNYITVRGLTKQGGLLTGADAVDQETGQTMHISARVVVNATGIFTDEIRRMDEPSASTIMALSRGTHIMLDASFLSEDTAILVPKTEDGRVVFIIPWEGRTLVGTTDIPVDEAVTEPDPTEAEIDFLLHHASLYLRRKPQRSDVLSAFAGLRPLVSSYPGTTAKLSRDYTLLVSESGLVTITGGKWTTYRRMAEDTINRAAETGVLPERASVTSRLPLVGAGSTNPGWKELGASDAEIRKYEENYPGRLHPDLPYTLAMAAYTIDHEMPVRLDDVLSRRLRALLLSAEAAVACAPAVARLMAERQGRDADWVQTEVAQVTALARRYGMPPDRQQATA